MKHIKVNRFAWVPGVLAVLAVAVLPTQALAGKGKGGGGGGANAPEITSVLIDKVEGDMFIYGFRLWTDDCPDVKFGGELVAPVQCSGVDPQEQAILIPLPVAPPLEDGSHLLEVSGDNGEDQFEVALGRGGCTIQGSVVSCDDGSSSDVQGPQGIQGPEGPTGPEGPQGPAGEDGSVVFPPIYNSGTKTCFDNDPCDAFDGENNLILSSHGCPDSDDKLLTGGCSAIGAGSVRSSMPKGAIPIDWQCVVEGTDQLAMKVSCLDLDGDGDGL